MANRRFLSSSVGSFLLNLLAAVVIGGGCNSFCYGFAYAPNFITKIIQEETGITDDTSETSSAAVAATIPVKTRFPPEPNGYLHLGHAKAVSFNFAVARMFDGSCNMRMDDTNPTKEDEEYVESILEDVKWIQSGLYEEECDDENEATPWEGVVRKTSSYFDTIYECAEALILQGDAYVDSLSAEEMRENREKTVRSGLAAPKKALRSFARYVTSSYLRCCI
jgi:glutamyl/glutaminyl-tRNA synthetase